VKHAHCCTLALTVGALMHYPRIATARRSSKMGRENLALEALRA